MTHDQGRPDLVEQLAGARGPDAMRTREVAQERAALPRNHLVERGVAQDPRAGPLVVQQRLGPVRPSSLLWRRESVLDSLVGSCAPRPGAVQFRVKGRTSVSRPIHEVDLVALLEQIGHPSWPTVGASQPVEPLSAAAMDDDHRVGMPDTCRYPVLHVHLLAIDDRAARQFRALNTQPEVAPLRQVEHRRAVRRLGGGCHGCVSGACSQQTQRCAGSAGHA